MWCKDNQSSRSLSPINYTCGACASPYYYVHYNLSFIEFFYLTSKLFYAILLNNTINIIYNNNKNQTISSAREHSQPLKRAITSAPPIPPTQSNVSNDPNYPRKTHSPYVMRYPSYPNYVTANTSSVYTTSSKKSIPST